MVSSLRPSAARRTPKNDAESFTDPCTQTQHQHCNRNLLPEHSAIAYQSRHLAARTLKLSANRKNSTVLAGKRRTAPLTSLRAERAEGRKDVAAWSAMSSSERKRLPRGRVDGTSCEQPDCLRTEDLAGFFFLSSPRGDAKARRGTAGVYSAVTVSRWR